MFACVAFGGFGFAAVALDISVALAPLGAVLHAPLFFFALVEWPALDAARRLAVAPALHLVLQGSACGALGFVVRATNVPERWTTARRRARGSLFFDILGSSHQRDARRFTFFFLSATHLFARVCFTQSVMMTQRDTHARACRWWHFLTMLGPILCLFGNARLYEFRMTPDAAYPL